MELTKLGSSLYSKGRNFFCDQKGNANEKTHEITIGEDEVLKRVMSTPQFLEMKQSEQGIYLYEKGYEHKRNHYETEGGNPMELSLAMLFFNESRKLNNRDAKAQLKIQKEVEEATVFYNEGLKYWNGSDGYDVNHSAAKRYMEMACKLGLFVAMEWRQNFFGIPCSVVIQSRNSEEL